METDTAMHDIQIGTRVRSLIEIEPGANGWGLHVGDVGTTRQVFPPGSGIFGCVPISGYSFSVRFDGDPDPDEDGHWMHWSEIEPLD